MPLPRRDLNKNWLIRSLLAALAAIACIAFVDLPVARFVKENLYSSARWSRLTSELPDLLAVVVLVATCAALWVYLVRSSRGICDDLTRLAKTVSWVAPASFATKHFLKFVFGRYNTRRWVHDPSLYGFYPFERRAGCDGFPSGHMLVVVALLAASWRFYPRTRPLCVVTAFFLAVALVVTNYHFVSDVVAGAYLGILVEAVAFRLLFREPSKQGSPSTRCQPKSLS